MNIYRNQSVFSKVFIENQNISVYHHALSDDHKNCVCALSDDDEVLRYIGTCRRESLG